MIYPHLVVLGGDGSFKGMQVLSDESEGISFAGIPSTIDNDIAGTEYCLGVDTALNVIRVCDRLYQRYSLFIFSCFCDRSDGKRVWVPGTCFSTYFWSRNVSDTRDTL